LRSFAPPPEPWDAGSRGVDLAATAGEPVFAGAAGQVIYAGLLAGRGVVSIADGSIHLTYEPLDPSVAVGSWVVAGAVIGHVSDEIDDCGPPGSCLHWGVRSGSGYLDPIALLGVPTVRLLPIWSDVAPEAAVTMTAAAATARPVGEPRACPLPKLAPQCW
jgi:murein DD-endopeptidase MepM/ murein hydrolase activator NlpD